MAAIKIGDPVIYVERDTYPHGQGGMPTHRELLGIIKLNLPLEAYSTAKQNAIYQLLACTGNEQESCVQTANQEIYPRIGEGGNGLIAPHQIQGGL